MQGWNKRFIQDIDKSPTETCSGYSNLHLHNTHLRKRKIRREITKLEFADKCRLGPCRPLFSTTVILSSVSLKAESGQRAFQVEE